MRQQISSTQKALNLWAFILIIWSIYRFKFQLPEWFDELIAKPLIFILPVFYYITKIEKKDLLFNIYLKNKESSKEIILGLILGIFLFIIAIFTHYIKSGKVQIFSNNILSLRFLTWNLLIITSTAISEEILSRGFILKRLYEESKNIFTSSFFASTLFFFLHVPILFTNTKITGNLLLLFLTTDLILSLAISFIFLIRKSLILPILIHMFYNLTIVIYGFS